MPQQNEPHLLSVTTTRNWFSLKEILQTCPTEQQALCVPLTLTQHSPSAVQWLSCHMQAGLDWKGGVGGDCLSAKSFGFCRIKRTSPFSFLDVFPPCASWFGFLGYAVTQGMAWHIRFFLFELCRAFSLQPSAVFRRGVSVYSVPVNHSKKWVTFKQHRHFCSQTILALEYLSCQTD